MAFVIGSLTQVTHGNLGILSCSWKHFRCYHVFVLWWFLASYLVSGCNGLDLGCEMLDVGTGACTCKSNLYVYIYVTHNGDLPRLFFFASASSSLAFSPLSPLSTESSLTRLSLWYRSRILFRQVGNAPLAVESPLIHCSPQ